MREITEEDLIKLQDIQLKRFKRNKENNSIPQRMFNKGKFNENNWNGGDNLIRLIDYDTIPKCSEGYVIKNKVTFKYRKDLYKLNVVIRYDYFNESSYLTINIDGIQENEQGNERGIRELYNITWYKNRGKTDTYFSSNGDSLEGYVFLLNVIQNTFGYDIFKIREIMEEII